MAKGVAFTGESAKRIGRVVQTVERSGPPRSGRQSQSPSAGPPWSLAKAQESFGVGQTGKVKLYGGTEKGAELDLQKEVDCYTRYWPVTEGDWMKVINIGGGWEVDAIKNHSAPSGHAVIRKLTLEGDLVWIADFSVSPETNNLGQVHQVDELVVGDGALLAIGLGTTSGSGYGGITRLDLETGTILKQFFTQGNGSSQGSLGDIQAARIDSDATHIVFSSDGYIQILDHDGLVVWVATTGTSIAAGPVKIGPDGDVYIQPPAATSIKSYPVGSNTAVRTITTSGTLRDLAWDPVDDSLYAVFASSAGKELRKFDLSNSVVWDYEQGNSLYSVDVDESQNVLVGGIKATGGSGGTGSVRLLDSSGTVLWSNGLLAVALDVCCDGEGGYYATGGRNFDPSSPSNTIGVSRAASAFTTIKFDASGNVVWKFDHGAYARALTIHDGHIYVGGDRSAFTQFNLVN